MVPVLITSDDLLRGIDSAAGMVWQVRMTAKYKRQGHDNDNEMLLLRMMVRSLMEFYKYFIVNNSIHRKYAQNSRNNNST